MWVEMGGKLSQNTCKLPNQRFYQTHPPAPKNKLPKRWQSSTIIFFIAHKEYNQYLFCVVYICSTSLFGCLVLLKNHQNFKIVIRICSEGISYICHSNRSAHAHYICSSLVLIDIHAQVFTPHRYSDDIPHGYRKSFSLMGKVQSCSLNVLA